MLPNDLPHEEKTALHSFLMKNLDMFSWTPLDLGYTNAVRHKIPVLSDTPIAQAYRRIPPSQFEDVRQHIQELANKGIIKPSSSPYASPIVVVRKKDGSIRLCIDYRKLNAITRKDAFPLPRIDESFDSLCGAKYFSTLDLASGYHQVAMEETDQEKTAFMTPFGLYEFTRMPFGLSGAPATFQRLMQSSMNDLVLRIILVYIDDVLVFSGDFDDHIKRLETLFNRLRELGLKLNPEKCQFGAREVHYLGHIISKEGVATDPDKVSAVNEWPTPKTTRELRSFLGLASYYRKFIEGFAKIAKPLHQLTSRVNEQLPRTHRKDRTLQLLRRRCFWPQMADDVQKYCNQCHRCQIAKKPGIGVHQTQGHLLATAPLEIVAMDFTKLEPASDGREDVLVLTDVFTKWTMAIPTRDQSAKSVTRVLIRAWIPHYGVPRRLHSDQGKCSIPLSLHITRHTSTTLTPQSLCDKPRGRQHTLNSTQVQGIQK
ncbi:Pol polyprotein [Plakobranchus ocellatus]|uniref:Pol polyprotein n=1 Tax=Plakobranchus ocellatus TaxID=259542 RepID=A0AAV4CYF4_9GAST|nr:Pol polyprotein [Plakobranchus ocellatus]